MKPPIFIIFLLSLTDITYSQKNIEQEKQRLIAEIKNCDYVESYCLGEACNSYSELYKKADTLFTLTNKDDALTYFGDSSYSLKYYSFLHLLDYSDSLAFELLKRNITDETKIDYTFADLSSNTKFVNLLIHEYQNFIKSKYFFGGRTVMSGHRILNFPPANKYVYKRKNKELDQLLKKNNIAFK